MTNKDLIRQYVDTGVPIPEYQYNRLSGNLRNTYERKRVISLKKNNTGFHSYEISFFPSELKEKFRSKAKFYLKDFIRLIDMPAKFLFFLDAAEQKDYLRKITGDGVREISREKFEALTEENKVWYAKMRIESLRKFFGKERLIINDDVLGFHRDYSTPYYIKAHKILRKEEGK